MELCNKFNIDRTAHSHYHQREFEDGAWAYVSSNCVFTSKARAPSNGPLQRRKGPFGRTVGGIWSRVHQTSAINNTSLSGSFSSLTERFFQVSWSRSGWERLYSAAQRWNYSWRQWSAESLPNAMPPTNRPPALPSHSVDVIWCLYNKTPTLVLKAAQPHPRCMFEHTVFILAKVRSAASCLPGEYCTGKTKLFGCMLWLRKSFIIWWGHASVCVVIVSIFTPVCGIWHIL